MIKKHFYISFFTHSATFTTFNVSIMCMLCVLYFYGTKYFAYCPIINSDDLRKIFPCGLIKSLYKQVKINKFISVSKDQLLRINTHLYNKSMIHNAILQLDGVMWRSAQE